MPRASYPGRFDPVPFGPLALIRRGVAVFGEVTVAVARNRAKKCLFTVAERVRLLEDEPASIPGVRVASFDGLVVDYCLKLGFDVILRGLRTVTDFEFEFQMALTNRHLAHQVETVFMMPSEKYSFVTSTLIREILASGGEVCDWLPPRVKQALKAKLEERNE